MFEGTNNSVLTGNPERTTVGDLTRKINAAKLDPETGVVCELESGVKGLWLNKRTTVGRVLELLEDFGARVAVTVRLTPIG